MNSLRENTEAMASFEQLLRAIDFVTSCDSSAIAHTAVDHADSLIIDVRAELSN